MIVEQAATLKLLVERATEAADVGNRDAALATVEDRLSLVRRELAMYAIAHPPWRDELPEPVCDSVMAAIGELMGQLEPLARASDDELVAYGSINSAAERGGLAAIVRQKDDLVQALQTAQNQLLAVWLQSLWPAEQRAELEVLAHLPEGKEAAEKVLLTFTSLLGETEEPHPISSERLGHLKQRVDEAIAHARDLGRHPVPEDVVAFWRAVAQQEDGISLAALSLDVHRWLIEHGAVDQFVISQP